MNYASIKIMDVANGPGIRISLFVSGCRHYCPGCFNAEAWDFQYGEPFTKENEDYIIDYVKSPHIAGLSLLGGEPLEPENQIALLPFLRRFKEECPDKTIWCYTGFDYEEDILGRMFDQYDETRELISYIDVLVDGKYIEALKDLSIRFRGSSNQRIIKVPESLRENRIVLYEEN